MVKIAARHAPPLTTIEPLRQIAAPTGYLNDGRWTRRMDGETEKHGQRGTCSQTVRRLRRRGFLPPRHTFIVNGEAINALAVRHGARRGPHQRGGTIMETGGEERDEAPELRVTDARATADRPNASRCMGKERSSWQAWTALHGADGTMQI